MATSTLCVGLQQAYREPVSPGEWSDDQDGEAESNTIESWNGIVNIATNTSVLDAASKGVSDNTFTAYTR